MQTDKQRSVLALLGGQSRNTLVWLLTSPRDMAASTMSGIL